MRRLTTHVPESRNEFVMVGGALYLGTALAAFVPPATVAAFVAQVPLPPAALAVAVVLAVLGLAHIGVPQIVAASVLGGAFGNASALGVSPLVLGSGLLGAWAVSASTTPVGAASLTVARLAGVPVGVVCRDWNGMFTLAAAVLLAAWMFGLAAIL